MNCYMPSCKNELGAFSICTDCATKLITDKHNYQHRIKELEEGLNKILSGRLEDEEIVILAEQLLSKQGGKE